MTGPARVDNQLEGSISKEGKKENAMIPHSVISASRPMGDLSAQADMPPNQRAAVRHSFVWGNFVQVFISLRINFIRFAPFIVTLSDHRRGSSQIQI